MRRIIMKNGTHLSIPEHIIIRIFTTNDPKYIKLKTTCGDFVVDGTDFFGQVYDDLVEA